MKTILYIDSVSFQKEELCQLIGNFSNVCFVLQNHNHLETIKQWVSQCISQMNRNIQCSFNLLEDFKRNHAFVGSSF